MGCNCGDKIKQDFQYIRKLAYAFGKTNEVDVQIYAFYTIGLTKYYDFDELPTREKRSEIVEIIRFQQHESPDILQDAKEAGVEVDDQAEAGKLSANGGGGKGNIKKVAKNTGTVS